MKEIVKPLLDWYDQNKRDLPWRLNKDPYRIWISEIMLQQTQVKTVIPYYHRFLENLSTIKDLANVTDDQLLKLWQGLGYYSRAKNLKIAANQIMNDYDGIFPRQYEEIRKLKGIGDYTAGAISSIAFDQKTPAIDGNVMRVFARLLAYDDYLPSSKFKKELYQLLESIYPDRSGDFTQSLMELGALVCLGNALPKCEICPLSTYCKAYKTNTVLKYPLMKKSKQRKVEKHTILLLEHNQKLALSKRPSDGLLSNLYEFINLDGFVDEEILQTRYPTIEIRKMKSHKHIFSHIEWHMKAYHLLLKEKNDTYIWVDLQELENDYPLPSAYLPFLNEYKKNRM